jgi:hypothetical protein
MITSEQFDAALKIISDYKNQLENEYSNAKSNQKFIDIQKDVTIRIFFILQLYYLEIHKENINWNSLKNMNLEKLTHLDYSILRSYRGFGKVSERKLKNIIALYVHQSELNCKKNE